eukprot:scaffold16612_cov114-Skeletonema_menzelii.AAC.1
MDPVIYFTPQYFIRWQAKQSFILISSTPAMAMPQEAQDSILSLFSSCAHHRTFRRRENIQLTPTCTAQWSTCSNLDRLNANSTYATGQQLDRFENGRYLSSYETRICKEFRRKRTPQNEK